MSEAIKKKSFNKLRVLLIVFIVLSFIVNLFILIESAIPGEASKAQSDSLGTIIGGITNNESSEAFNYVIRKLIGHFSLFAGSGFLTHLTLDLYARFKSIDKKKYVALISIGIGIFLSVFSEILQMITPGRFFSFEDILINFIGYLIGFGIAKIIIYYIYRKKPTHN